jgi:hypothetical protein
MQQLSNSFFILAALISLAAVSAHQLSRRFIGKIEATLLEIVRFIIFSEYERE